MITLTPEQDFCVKDILAWYDEAIKIKRTQGNFVKETERTNGIPQFYVFGGYAGTGKTTTLSFLILELYRKFKMSAHVCALTGKASTRILDVLKESLVLDNSATTVSTIHRMMYAPKKDIRGKIIGWDRKPEILADIIIIDEGSMLDPIIWRDLLSYDIPVLVVGDPFQLPPIISKQTLKLFPNSQSFNLLAKPDVMLTEIHRQAENHPIIKLSMLIRQEKMPPYLNGNKKDAKVMHLKRSDHNMIDYRTYEFTPLNERMILTGTNKMRKELNNLSRSKLGFPEYRSKDGPGWVQPGEYLVCLKNDYYHEIFNGQVVEAESYTYSPNRSKITLKSGAEIQAHAEQINNGELQWKALSNLSSFGRAPLGLFDYGYALTVHKAQGSQTKHVILHNATWMARKNKQDYFRWLYTGITRATDYVTLIT